MSGISVEGAAQKQKRRLQLRQEYLKQISDPHRHATGEGGTLVSFNQPS